MALTPGTRCPCGCGCAIPKTKTVKGCPCVCAGTCPTCGPAVSAKAEAVGPQPTRTYPAAKKPISVESASQRVFRESAVPTPAPNTFTAEQFAQLLAQVTETRARNQAAETARVAEAQEATRIAENEALQSLSQQQLGARLVARLTETWGVRSPGWKAGRSGAAVTETAQQQPAGLAAAAQALPIAQQSMSLTEALVSVHDLHSPAWTRPAGLQGARTIFDA